MNKEPFEPKTDQEMINQIVSIARPFKYYSSDVKFNKYQKSFRRDIKEGDPVSEFEKQISESVSWREMMRIMDDVITRNWGDETGPTSKEEYEKLRDETLNDPEVSHWSYVDIYGVRGGTVARIDQDENEIRESWISQGIKIKSIENKPFYCEIKHELTTDEKLARQTYKDDPENAFSSMTMTVPLADGWEPIQAIMSDQAKEYGLTTEAYTLDHKTNTVDTIVSGTVSQIAKIKEFIDMIETARNKNDWAAVAESLR